MNPPNPTPATTTTHSKRHRRTRIHTQQRTPRPSPTQSTLWGFIQRQLNPLPLPHQPVPPPALPNASQDVPLPIMTPPRRLWRQRLNPHCCQNNPQMPHTNIPPCINSLSFPITATRLGVISKWHYNLLRIFEYFPKTPAPSTSETLI